MRQTTSAFNIMLGFLSLSNRDLAIVVDDDPAMLSGVARLLKQHGYDTNLFASAEAFKGHKTSSSSPLQSKTSESWQS